MHCRTTQQMQPGKQLQTTILKTHRKITGESKLLYWTPPRYQLHPYFHRKELPLNLATERTLQKSNITYLFVPQPSKRC